MGAAGACLVLAHAWQRCEQPPAAGTALPWEEAAKQLVDVYNRYDGPGEPDPEADYANEVEREARRLRVREAARAKVAAERLALVEVPPLPEFRS